MKSAFTSSIALHVLPFLALLAPVALADDVLQTNGFSNCMNNPSISVQTMDISFDHSTNTVHFDVEGKSDEVQNVTAILEISAYGQAFNKSFDPCGKDIHVDELCPVPKGTFGAKGSWAVPAQYVNQVPSIVWNIPDLQGIGKVELQSSSGKDVACISSNIGNTKTTTVPGVTYAAAAIAAGALVVSSVSALSAGASVAGKGGGSTASPTFVETIHWFQGMAMNGMLSVQYPGVYRDFSRNFAFSTGIIPWNSVNVRIDNFRQSTGGNLTNDNVQYLQNSTIVYQNPNQPDASANTKRSLAHMALENTILFVRDGVTTNVNGTSSNEGTSGGGNDTASAGGAQQQNYVQGISAYVEQLMVPKSNTFMLILLVFAIILAAITAGILLFKVILEAWSLFGNFPKKLTSFRKNYWWLLAKTITNCILALYSVWVLYCVYQFKIGDSWAARALAGITLAMFTGVLVWFTWRIWHKAHVYRKMEGDNAVLYDDKETWRKYSIFYDSYKRSYYWLFIPAIIYMFARGCIIALGDGHGMAQCVAQLIVEGLFLVLLIMVRPYNLKSGNWINIIIQVVRVISVVCILVFVEELGISQTTQTVTGWVLVIVQGVLTGVLGILICVNALINCCRMNPHRRKRKEAEELAKRDDLLTPLDARNSLLMGPMEKKQAETRTEMVSTPVSSTHNRGFSGNGYDLLPRRGSAQPYDRSRSVSPVSMHRYEPQLPDVEYKGVAI